MPKRQLSRHGHIRLCFAVLWAIGWTVVQLSSRTNDETALLLLHARPPSDAANRHLRHSADAAGSLPARVHHRQRALPSIVGGCTEPNVIALTFDDGPTHPVTDGLLEILAAEDIRATFFQIGFGPTCLYDPTTAEVLKRMLLAGHQLGSHTWTHANLQEIDYKTVMHEMSAMDAAHITMLGASPRFFRPPWGGLQNPHFNLTQALSANYAITLWDTDSEDWNSNVTLTLEKYDEAFSKRPVNGSILALHHDSFETTLIAIPMIIAEAKRQGLRFVTVGECIGLPDPSDWYTFSNPHAPAYDDETGEWTFPHIMEHNAAGEVIPRPISGSLGEVQSKCVK